MKKKCRRNDAEEMKKKKGRNETIRRVNDKEMQKKCRRNAAVEMKKKKLNNQTN